MESCKGLRRGLVAMAVALACSLAVFMSEAKASTVDLGNVSSATGSLSLSGFTLGFPLPVGTDAYSFTLTDNAKVSGHFTVSALPLVPLNIDLLRGATTLVHTTAMLGLTIPLSPPLVIVPDQISLFSLDLTPGTYLLTLRGSVNNFSGTLAFGATSIAATPIPAALPLFTSALIGLGFVGWRRRSGAAAC